jgi:hypothetical protein
LCRERASWAFAINKGGESVRRKLEGARMYARKLKLIGKKDVDYSTSESASESEMKEWDRKFGGKD